MKIDKNDPASGYSAIYDKCFELDERNGYAFLEEQMDEKAPSCGYAILAWILSNTPNNVVIKPTIAIPERKNPHLQQSNMPAKYWKYLNEKQGE